MLKLSNLSFQARTAHSNVLLIKYYNNLQIVTHFNLRYKKIKSIFYRC